MGSDVIVSTLINKGEKYQRLVKRFVDSLPQFLTDIEQAFQANDSAEIKAQIHRLKGVSGNYGFPQLSELCASIETEVKNNAELDRQTRLQEIKELMDKISRGMNSDFGEPEGPFVAENR